MDSPLGESIQNIGFKIGKKLYTNHHQINQKILEKKTTTIFTLLQQIKAIKQKPRRAHIYMRALKQIN